jgi:hypothetical protein
MIAIRALDFIAADAERLGLFLAETSIGPATLRKSAADPRFLASVLDFVMRMTRLKAFAKMSDLHPTNIAAARDALGDPNGSRELRKRAKVKI